MVIFLIGILDAHAGLKKDIGFSALKTTHGPELPNGSTIPLVTQTEGPTLIDHDGNENTAKIKAWMPNPSHKGFSGKDIVNRSGSLPYYSGHATSVGLNFFGNNQSMTPGIKNIEVYLAAHWLGPGFLRSDRGVKPLTSSSRVSNHSWVASTRNINSSVLRRIDWVISTDDSTQVVGPCRPGQPLLGSAYNVIAVGQASGENGKGTASVDKHYTPDRTCPQIIAPRRTASAAAPVVASAAALLIELGHNTPALSTDPVSRSTSNRNGDTIYNAERSEVIKAALMAGADRMAQNTVTIDNRPVYITDYRIELENRAVNGLDKRYGAGQLNIDNSYRIISAGEQNSREDLPESGGNIAVRGFDYDPEFGGKEGSNTKASYYFKVNSESQNLWASLVWNTRIVGGEGPYFTGTAMLYDLDLVLYDITGKGKQIIVASSQSKSDNTENLWVKLKKNHRYLLQVKRSTKQTAFKWDYALAWRVGE